MEVNVLRSCVRNRIGKTKTESSCRPVPLHPLVLSALLSLLDTRFSQAAEEYNFAGSAQLDYLLVPTVPRAVDAPGTSVTPGTVPGWGWMLIAFGMIGALTLVALRQRRRVVV